MVKKHSSNINNVLNESLIKIDNGEPYTTSLDVARVFEKEHKIVLRDIRNISNKDDFRENNFVPTYYIDEQNKKRPMYKIKRKGLTMLIMGYTGEKAFDYKVGYINLFELMEKKLRELQSDDRNTIEWQNKRGESKQIRMGFCEAVSSLIEYAKKQGSENAGYYYSNLTKQVNKSLFRIISLKKIFKNLRDEIDFKQLNSIITLEYILTKNIVIMMDNGVHYKDVYPKLKEICEQFGDLFGKEKPKYITYPEYEQCMDKKTKELFTIQRKQIQQRKAIG